MNAVSGSNPVTAGSWRAFALALGPGLLWAGAAIGVSHLVQSTRAGAGYGFTLVWAILLANFFKYPAFETGPRYATATGESLIEGYERLGRGVLLLYIVLTFLTLFTVQSAVTLVTAVMMGPLLGSLFGAAPTPFVTSAGLLFGCAALLFVGKFRALDLLMKGIIVLLSLSTIGGMLVALARNTRPIAELSGSFTWQGEHVLFLIALMGWMPSAVDVAVWHSLWSQERTLETGYRPTMRESLFDFNLGYVVTVVLALAFQALGALVMFGRGLEFKSGAGFALQFLELYTTTLGQGVRWVVTIAAFTAMFSTTITCLDAYGRVLQRLAEKFLNAAPHRDRLYLAWMLLVIGGTLLVLGVFSERMKVLVDFATSLSFLTAPFLAYLNLRVVTGSWVSEGDRPAGWLVAWHWLGIVFLGGFGVWYLAG